MTVTEIPLQPKAQSFSTLLGSTAYRMRLTYVDRAEGGWMLDIGDADGTPLVCGIALVAGADLLAPYAHLGFGGSLYVVSAGDPDADPGFADLGVGSRLYFAAA